MDVTRLCLRTCNPDGSSYGGFKWPLAVGATVEAPDWDPSPHCGNGLHGLLNGEGDGSLLDTSGILLVVEAVGQIVDLGEKVKFPSAIVRCVGTKEEATSFLLDYCPGKAIVFATVTGGDWATVTGGDRSTVTGGYEATVTGGEGSALVLSYYDRRKRIATAYVGENGIKPNTPYKLDSNNNFAEVK